MPRKVSVNELSVDEFRLLLQDEEFLDFFNKFCSLPAFSQLIVYSKSRKDFLFEPSFQNDQYKLNKRGLLKWLWKRCNLFVKTKWFTNFLFAKRLMENNLFHDVDMGLSSSDKKIIQQSLIWLARRSFGRVSGLRRFRRFLMTTPDGYKMYRFWLGAERLYQYIKRKSCTSPERLNKLKNNFFRECADLAFPRHLIDAAWATLDDSLDQSTQSSRIFDLNFTMLMQKLCMHRLNTYWTPRYLLSCTHETNSPSDDASYELAMRYLRKKFPEDFLTKGLANYLSVLPQLSEPGSAIMHDFEDTMINSKEQYDVYNGRGSKDDSLSADATQGRRRPHSYAGHRDKQNALTKGRRSPFNTFEEEKHKHKSRKRASSAPNANDDRNTELFKTKRMSSIPSSGSSEDDHSLISMGSDDSIKKKIFKKPRKKIVRRRTEDLTSKWKKAVQKSSTFRYSISGEVKHETRKKSTVVNLKIVDDIVDDDVEPHESDVKSLEDGKSPDSKLGNKATKGHQKGLPDRASPSNFEEDTDEDKDRRRSSVSEIEKLDSDTMQDRSQNKSSSNLIESPLEIPKKRKISFRARPKKTKITTLTFTLSGKTEKQKKNPSNTNIKFAKSKTRRSFPKAGEDMKSDLNQLLKAMKKKSEKLRQSNLLLNAGDPVLSLQEDFKYRNNAENRRMIAALQTDHAAGNPFRRFLTKSGNEEMYDLLTFWQHTEKLRPDYKFGSMSFHDFSKSLISLVTNHLLPNSPFRIDASERIPKSVVDEVLSCEPYEMPWELRKLQEDALEDLKPSYESYIAQDVQAFYNVAAIKIEEEPNILRRLSVFKKRRLSSIVLSPIQSMDHMPPLFSGMEMQENPLKREMIRRMYRAQKLVVEEHLPSGRKQFFPGEEEESDLSDDDGHPTSPPPPVIIRDPPENMKDLAALSAVEYPNLNETSRLVAMKERRFQRRSANFYKPIKRGGQILRRPTSRPISFHEVLKDTVHLEFFKRYLKAYRSETPMQFWLAVEGLRGADNTKKRQKKAKQIIKRYFHSNKGSATKLMQCQADVIKEIPYLDMVTTGMLFVAQSAVAKSMEGDWFRKYVSTFPDVVPPKIASDESTVSETPKMTKKLDNEILKGPWGVFRCFIKRAAMFLHHMKDPKFVELFSKFLKKEALKDTIVTSQDKRSINLKAKRSGLLPNLYLEAEKEKKKVRQKVINRQLITLNFLEDDFKFWQEIQRYKLLAESCALHDPWGNSRAEDVKLLKRKASIIVRCFLDSNISPEIRVNLPSEVCDMTVESLQNGMLDVSLFHEATIYIFPLMVTFWKKFCEERYKYTPELSKKQLQIYGNKFRPAVTEAMAKEKKFLKEERKKRAKIADTVVPDDCRPNRSKEYFPDGRPPRSREHLIDCRPHRSREYFPDYARMKPSDFKKLRGSARDADDLGSRITFSIRLGPCLIQSGRGRKSTVIKAESPDVRFLIESGLSTSRDQRKSISHLSRRPSNVLTPKGNNKRLGFANLPMSTEIKSGGRLSLK